MMTVAELEAAVAALPGKRDALREAFDCLAAYSPSPLPFALEDLDAHLSSLHWSISLRFCQVRALEAARPAPAAAVPGGTNGDGTGESPEGEVVVEMEEEEEVLEAEEEVVEEDEEVVEEDEDVLEGEERWWNKRRRRWPMKRCRKAPAVRQTIRLARMVRTRKRAEMR